MEWERSQLLAILGTLLVVLVVFLWNSRKASDALANPTDDEHEGLLCRFVRHEADVVGETVAQEGDELILKQAGVFKSVPLRQIKDSGGELVLTGSIDWQESIRKGSGWLDRVRKGDAESVAGQMTRSEDVQNPALKALQDREEE